MKDFRKLQVWHKSHALTLEVYKFTKRFPADERFGLTSQLRRAASSVSANLAEGCGRNSDGELGRYTSIAMGSASELEYHLLLAHDLDYISSSQYQTLNEATVEIKRMLAALLRRLTADR